MEPGAIVAERFEVQALAGSGGMGEVWKALDLDDRHPVALKVLPVLSTPDVERRFEREARLLAELSHPGIVRYLAHGRTEESRLWLAMEWLEGEELGERIPLSIRECLIVVARAAEALGHAHACGVVHRDVKPGNLFLVDGRVDQVRVLDFGIARLMSRAGTLTGRGKT